MRDSIKKAFDAVHAEQALIEKTSAYLRSSIAEKKKPARHIRLRLVAVCTSMALFVFAGIITHRAYYSPVAYIDMDVNPSMELSVNRFGRVIGSISYNTDADKVLLETNVNNVTYTQAVNMLLDNMIQHAYLNPDGLVSVTVQANTEDTEVSLLLSLREGIASLLTSRSTDAAIEVYGVSKEVKESATTHHVSPAKYLAITELQAVDETITFESCSSHSIDELRQHSAAHGEESHDDTMTERDQRHH